MFNTKLENLLKQSNNGVFALINDSDRKVDVRHGSNLLQSIARLVESIKTGSVEPLELKTHQDKLYVQVLETNVPNPRLCHTKWMNHYKNLGYSLYRTTPGCRYDVVTVIDFLHGPKLSKYLFVLKLVAKDNVLVVGVFDNDQELKEFTSKYYANGEVNDIVYSANALTSSYHSNISRTVIRR